ncbi:MAG TPA: lysophospholipid acyltransferase family protein [Candidatus Saccharimonadales bacterium]|nr:lysophospholipid acyltransferase family protein [Candidatus Saccharimonadales bacterium]
MTSRADARWYTHGWNRDLSWKLILGIVPRVPRALRFPLHLLITTICFLAMGNERRAAVRNLRRVTGRGATRSLILAYRLFYNFSRFMVAYTDLPPFGDGNIDRRLVNGPQALAVLDGALSGGRGLIVLGMHLGQWELALISLARAGHPVTMVMRREEEEASRFAREARRTAGINVVYAGESPFMFVELLSVLRRNGIVAMQGDRSYGGRSLDVTMCGAPLRIPAGPWELAAVSGAPILPGVLVFEGGRKLRLVWGRRIAVAGRGGGGASDPSLLAAAMEDLISRYPQQWFNFFDLWQGAGERPRA